MADDVQAVGGEALRQAKQFFVLLGVVASFSAFLKLAVPSAKYAESVALAIELGVTAALFGGTFAWRRWHKNRFRAFSY